MKKLWTLMAMVAVFASCSQEEADSPLNTYTLTGYADVESRTAFDAPGTNKIPFKWSVDDFIYNGSTPSNKLSNNGISADFTFSGTPSSNEVYYNISGTSAMPKQANVKNAQTIGNLGTNGDFGYGTVSNGSFTLKHATSYLWFNVTSSLSNVTLQSVKVCADVNIAGKATWDGTSLGSVSEGNKSIELSVNEALSSTNDNVWAMVVLPNLANQSFKVTYKLKVGNNTKYYTETITGKQNFTSGTTQKVSLSIDNNTQLTDYAELRVLTFEDTDAKFTPYSLGYANKTINKWSDLIDDPQYNGPLTYDYDAATYYWYDENNTGLQHSFTTPYWGGGHAISNYVIEDYESLPEGHYGWHELQFATPIGGHNGSSNFAVHNGYSDFFNSQIYDASLVGFSFEEGVERVVDHMYVTNTNYLLNSVTYGDGFNQPAGEDTYVKIIAYGYNANDEATGTAEFYLVNGSANILTTWEKFDLSSLGKVNKIVFNFAASADQSGSYGLNCPAYFAYDDVAVQFTE